MSFYDEIDSVEETKIEKPISKKKVPKKTSTKRKKTPVKRKQVNKNTVQKTENSFENKIKKLKKLKKRKNESEWDFLIRASIETGLPGETIAEQIKLKPQNKPKPSNKSKKTMERVDETAENESKRHLDAGRSVYGRVRDERIMVHPEPDSTNTRIEYLDQPKQPEITPQEFFNSIEPKPEYEKHLIQCRCVLPLFQKMENPPDHQFIVFSELKEDGFIKPHYAQCNNCGLIHKVQEVGISETLKKETMASLPKKNDIKNELPEWAVNFLSENDCDLHVWQEINFILKHKLWGRFVVLAKDRDENIIIKKVCQILGDNLYKIENIEENEGWIEP